MNRFGHVLKSDNVTALIFQPRALLLCHICPLTVKKKKNPQKIIEKEASSLVISSKPPNLEVKTKVTAPAVAPRGWLQLNWETERRKYSASGGSRVEPELGRNNCDGSLLFNKKPPSQMSQLLCLDQSNYRNNSQTDAKKGDRCCDKPEVCFKATYGEDLN